MSRRGSKRKPVLQLSNSNSKLHRYGYSKEFHSKNKTGKGLALALVGNYSDSDSNEQSEVEDQLAGEVEPCDGEIPEHNVDLETGNKTLNDNSSHLSDMDKVSAHPSDMDNKLKSFLSEIEAIPVPSELISGQPGTVSAQSAKGSDTTQSAKGSDTTQSAKGSDTTQSSKDSDPAPDSNAATSKKSSANHYSMFVKGEIEFAQKPQQNTASQLTDENHKVGNILEIDDLPEEPTTSWQMVQDETTQYYYYWNMETNQVTWEIPSDYTQFLLLHQEYEEKMSKYTPEQLTLLQQRKAKKCLSEKTSSLLDSKKSDCTVPDAPSITSHVGYNETAPSKLSRTHHSPRPDSDPDTKRSKHKKEKKSHHKKKHKQRSNDDLSDEWKDDFRELLDLDKTNAPPMTSFAKIVPYLSDQDDEDEQPILPKDAKVISGNISSLRDPQGPTDSADSVATDAVLNMENLESTKLSSSEKTALTESCLVGTLVADKGQQKLTVGLNFSRDKSEGSPSTTGLSVGLASAASALGGLTQDPCSVDDILNSIIQPAVATVPGVEPVNEASLVEQSSTPAPLDREEPKKPKPGSSVTTDSSANVIKQDAADTVKDKGNKERSQSRRGLEKLELISEKKTTLLSGANTVKSVPVRELKPESKDTLKAEPMEEGEIAEPVCSKVSSSVSDRHGRSSRRPSSSPRSKQKQEGGGAEKKKVLNIVGYESEEEGEVREKRKHEESRSSSKKKKKDRKRESRRHSKDEKSVYPTLFEGKLDKEIISKVTDTLDQAISDIVAKTVSKAVGQVYSGSEEKPKVPEDETEEIDFDDLDDIDRALEVALEKKLEQKKVELSKYEEDDTKKLQASDTEVTVVNRTVEANSVSPAVSVKEDISEPPVAPCDASVAMTLEEPTESDTKLNDEVKSMSELALSKLEFLDISTDNLSRLQVLFIELQTRQTDWLAGGLSTQYYYKELKVAETLLEQYELSAVPEGWACQWDRANNRYYYRNKATNRIQWEYPEAEPKEKEEEKAAAVQEEADVICTKVESAAAPDEPHKQRSRRSSQRRKREEKDRSKREKRSTSHHYRRKRRRRRDHSSSSDSSELGQQHRRHHKSKKKKKHRSERSPSVKIIENPETVQAETVIDVPIKGKTNKESRSNSEEVAKTVVVAAETLVVPPPPPEPQTVAPPPPEEMAIEDSNVVQQDMEESADENYVEDYLYTEEAMYHQMMEGSAAMASMGVISKPPQIIVPQQCYANTMMPDVYASQTYHPSTVLMVPGQPCSSYLIQPPVPVAYTVSPPVTGDQVVEATVAEAPASSEADKQTKKKKKDKKSLATGSSIMMKKKHMSSMVQKWQKVKKEVEKEDMAKELRQAAIRKQIEELK